MNKQRLLFIINGLGLGNSTRCSAIIHELYNLDFKIDVITSSNGLNYFKESSEICELYSFQALLYGKANGKLSVVKTILILPQLIKFFIKNCIFLNSLIQKNFYDAIIFDSDYSVASLFWQKKRPPLIAINNASIIVQECKKNLNLPRSIRLQFWVEKLDCWFHNIIPDLVICPVFHRQEKNQQNNLKYIPPIIRSDLTVNLIKNKPNNILVMLSGSQFGSDIYFLDKLPDLINIKINVIGKTGLSDKKIEFYGKIYNNQNLINSADMLIINAGFSAISESIVLKKPALVIPIENHAEQYVNAHLFEKNKLGLLATQENAHEKIIELLSNFQQFTQSHVKFNTQTDGAKLASQYIVEKINSRKIII